MARRIAVRSVPEAIADQMQKEILEGLWKGDLPGYRVLARGYNAGKNSMISALTILERRGFVSGVERGSRRSVLKGKTEEKKVKKLLAIRWEQYGMDLASMETWVNLQELWRSSGGVVDELLVDMSRRGDLRARLSSLVASYHCDAVLLANPSKPWVQTFIDLGIPIFCRGGSLKNISHLVAGAGYCAKQTLIKILQELRCRGHVRVLSPRAKASLEYKAAFLDAFSCVLGDILSDEEREKLCPHFSESDPKSWQVYWRRHLSDMNPTAVICRSAHELLSLYGFCYRSNIRIPEDLSVICISDAESLQWVSPVPVSMAFPNESEKVQFKKWMKDGLPGFKLYSLDWVEAESVRRVKPFSSGNEH